MSRWLAIVVWLGAGVAGLRGGDALPMSPPGQVWIKPVPEFRVVQIEVPGNPFAKLDALSLKLDRFSAAAGLDRPSPLVVEFPSLDWKPSDTNLCHAYVLIPLGRTMEEPGDTTMYFAMRETSKVAAVSFSGAYTVDRFLARMKEMADYLRTNGHVIVGRPRLLLYHFQAFRPDFAKKAELQVPVR